MPTLVDGNNLLHQLPRGQRSRVAVRRLTLELARQETMRVTVVFDGPPPPGSPSREALGRVTIRYAGDRSADQVILASLPGDTAARQWVVVTDDRELARRARDRGATTRSTGEWHRRLASASLRPGDDGPLTPDQLAEWEAYFGLQMEKDD